MLTTGRAGIIAHKPSASPSPSPTPTPTPTPVTTQNLMGINLGTVNDYDARIFANIAQQARVFQPMTFDLTPTNNIQPEYTSSPAVITLTNAPAGRYKIRYYDGGDGTLSVSAGTVTPVFKSQLTGWSEDIFTVPTTQASMTVTITGATLVNNVELFRILPLTADGYPDATVTDAKMILWDAPQREGTYQISFTGRVTSLSGPNITNLQYSGGVTTATMTTTVDNGNVWLDFGGILEPISNLKIMAPITRYSTTSYPTNQIFDTNYIEKAAVFQAARFMDTGGTNSNHTVNWADRTPPNIMPQGVYKAGNGFSQNGMSWEYQIALANAIKSYNPDFRRVWFCMPTLANDDYFAQFANLLLNGGGGFSGINPDLEVQIEVGNELWNFGPGFRQYQWNIDQAKIDILTPEGSVMDYDENSIDDFEYGQRRAIWRTYKLAQALYAASPTLYGTKWFVVCCWQQGNSQATANRMARMFEALNVPANLARGFTWGGSAYYNPDNHDPALTIETLWNQQTMNIENWRPILEQDRNYVVALSYPTGVPAWDSYEGGPSLDEAFIGMDATGGGTFTAPQVAATNAVKRQALFDSRMRSAVVTHHNIRSTYAGNYLYYYSYDGLLGDTEVGAWSFQSTIYYDLETEATFKMQGILELNTTNRVAPLLYGYDVQAPNFGQPPVVIRGSEFAAVTRGYGGPSADNSEQIQPGVWISYNFHVSQATQYQFSFTVVGGPDNSWKIGLGNLVILGATSNVGTTPISVVHPTVLQPGLYALKIINNGTQFNNIDNITITAVA